MDKLIITQDEGVIEYCNSGIVPKLYLILHDGLTDNTSSLSGTIHVDSARSDYINYITNHAVSTLDGISKFHISCDRHYMIFLDPFVESQLAKITGIGDGIGVFEENKSLVTSNYLNVFFSQQTSLLSFDELSLFTHITNLKNDTFYGCNLLTSIDLSNISTIGDNVFFGCSSLSNINTNLSNITSIGEGAFRGTAFAVNIDLSGLTVNGISTYSFYYSDIIGISDVSSSVVDIGQSAFGYCTSLVTADFSNSSLKRIYNGAFEGNTSLKYVKLPSTVTEILSYAFSGCTALEYIVCMAATPPPLYYGVFSSNIQFDLIKVYVPDASVSEYRSADYWKWFSILPVSQFATDYPNS